MGETVATEGLCFGVGQRSILHDVSVTIGAGEIFAILGTSGSGKTTLLKCLAGLLRPASGSIRVGGEELAGMGESDLNDRRRRMGMVFQYAALFDSLPVWENVIFGLRQHQRLSDRVLRDRARLHLAAVGLDGADEMLPASLSGGMRKRVGLARALAMEPGVIYYDEPTSGLDPVVARRIDSLIGDVCKNYGVTSVVVSHDLPGMLALADRLALLDDGRVIQVATPAQFRASGEGLARDFLEASFVGGEAPGAAVSPSSGGA